MTSHKNSHLTFKQSQQSNINRVSPPFKRFLEIITHYDTPKVVRFESKWIASLSLLVKFSLAISCIYLMCQRNSYQIFDRSPISAVTIKVKTSPNCSRNATIMKHFKNYDCMQSIYDVNDFILPATENSAISITTRVTEVEHILQSCEHRMQPTQGYKYSSTNSTVKHNCYVKSRCILPPLIRHTDKNLTRTNLCWFKLLESLEKNNYQALDYVLFIKHFVEFPQLGLIRVNLIPNFHSKDYIEHCEYDPIHHPLCPKFRILKILEMIEKDPDEYERMFSYGSLIEIKITWKCNLDRHIDLCEPLYEFHRLDLLPYEKNPYEPGSSFLTSNHFFRPNDGQLHRLHTTVYNLHIIVSVTGEVGRFDLFQTTTSIGSFLGIFGTGTIVCDVIAAFFTNFKSVKYDS